MALHELNEIGVRRCLQLVFGDFLDALDEVVTRGAVEEDLRIGLAELQVRHDVGLTDQHRQPLKARRGANGLAMDRNGRGKNAPCHRKPHNNQ